jgi:hypothetical protein
MGGKRKYSGGGSSARAEGPRSGRRIALRDSRRSAALIRNHRSTRDGSTQRSTDKRNAANPGDIGVTTISLSADAASVGFAS